MFLLGPGPGPAISDPPPGYPAGGGLDRLERWLGRAVDGRADALVLDDGRELTSADIDYILFCTGYRFSLPFFHVEEEEEPPAVVSVLEDGSLVSPLFANFAHATHTRSLFFIGFGVWILPFLAAEYQVQFGSINKCRDKKIRRLLQIQLAIALIDGKFINGSLPRDEVEGYERRRIE